MHPPAPRPTAASVRVLATLVAMVTLSSCAPALETEQSPRSRNTSTTYPHPTLLVVNRTGTHLSVRVGRVFVGRATVGANCFDLTGVPQGGQIVEIAATRRRTAQTLTPEVVRSQPGWRITLRSPALLKYDMNVQPAPACRPSS